MAKVRSEDGFDVVLIDTGDAQADESIGGFETAKVIAVDRKAGRMAAGASELVELQGRNDIIVNVLSQRVAYFKG